MVFKKIFGSGKLRKPVDLSILKADMHSHLIPGIDDGAPDLDASLDLVRQLKALGYEKIITTPHIQQDYYQNTPGVITSGLEKLKTATERESIGISIEAAAEYLIDDGIEEKIEAGGLMTFGDRYLLVELSYYNPHPNLKGIIFNLQVEGYKVVLAHPERYSYWFSDWKKFTELKDRGVYFQLNIVSLAGYYPEPVRKFAQKFIEEGMIEFAGTDAHNNRYMEAVRAATIEKHFDILVKSGKLLNAVI
jgi:tyrosine-protein phosphatase YwqE